MPAPARRLPGHGGSAVVEDGGGILFVPVDVVFDDIAVKLLICGTVCGLLSRCAEQILGIPGGVLDHVGAGQAGELNVSELIVVFCHGFGLVPKGIEVILIDRELQKLKARLGREVAGPVEALAPLVHEIDILAHVAPACAVMAAKELVHVSVVLLLGHIGDNNQI